MGAAALVPWNPYEQDFKEEAYPPYAPSLAERHFLGTDTSGRDVLARLVYGFRIAIGFAFIALVASYVIGVSIGCMMGFLGGRFDLIPMQRFIEIWSQVPFLYVIMILVSWPSRTSACSSASTCCSAGWGSPGTCAPSPTRSGRGTT